MSDSQFIRLTPHTLPSLISILRISQFGACDTEGTSIILILCVCSFLEHSSDPEHEINLRGAPYELVLMTDVISEGSGEHVCLHNLVRVSLTNKV